MKEGGAKVVLLAQPTAVMPGDVEAQAESVETRDLVMSKDWYIAESWGRVDEVQPGGRRTEAMPM